MLRYRNRFGTEQIQGRKYCPWSMRNKKSLSPWSSEHTRDLRFLPEKPRSQTNNLLSPCFVNSRQTENRLERYVEYNYFPNIATIGADNVSLFFGSLAFTAIEGYLAESAACTALAADSFPSFQYTTIPE
jgi:hypothetical protein